MHKIKLFIVILPIIMSFLLANGMSNSALNKGNTFLNPFGIYYGWPSSLNSDINIGDNKKIINDINTYKVFVLGEGLENKSHPDHKNLLLILSGYKGDAFGYVTMKRAELDAKNRIDQRKDTPGIKGIFFDEAGYDYLLRYNGMNTKMAVRTRQNTLIDYAHSKGLKIIINSWNVDDVLGTGNGEKNINLLTTDGYLFESFVYNPAISSPYYDYDSQLNLSKINKYKNYNKKYNLNTYCVGMLPHNSDIKQINVDKLKEKAKGFCNYIQITNANFSASGTDNSKMKNYYK